MAYEPGEYTEELKAAHHNGEHVEREDLNCPVCNFQEVPDGFSSIDEYLDALSETACMLQEYVDDHEEGKHKGKPNGMCIECAQESGDDDSEMS